ncbi:hypothetical protein GH5_06317 [Leishmania sp. Ghana 2012 LV757]|uniref:hypothetical protein n=1 Tax=Leishmania sp. Ghana 2012 LV757 TaxID=2803181 RepID=UPI001B499ED4|nr:hypothetical protein GH5_06317 [Leishmania sp. Ghana 2012 LV757]
MPSLEDYRAPYPAPAPGQERKVIYLPPQDFAVEQQHLRVQIIPGRHENCEDGRLYELGGTVSEEVVQECGYPYYVVTLGDMRATNRSLSDPENATTFVALHESPFIAYNSKLPIVVYVPEGAAVRYRVWSDDASRRQKTRQQPEAPAVPPSPPAPTPEEQAHSKEHPQGDGPEEHVTQNCEEPLLSAEENWHTSDKPPSTPPAEQESAHEAHSVPALYSAELEESPRPETEHPEGNVHKSRKEPAEETLTSERRGSSSPKARKHSAGVSSPSHARLSSTENSPRSKSKTGHAPSAAHQKRHSTGSAAAVDENGDGASKQTRSSSGTSSRKGDRDSSYEKKAKELWNRARSNSSPRKSASPKKNGGGGSSKGDL